MAESIGTHSLAVKAFISITKLNTQQTKVGCKIYLRSNQWFPGGIGELLHDKPV